MEPLEPGVRLLLESGWPGGVRLATAAWPWPGELDCSAANALMHARVQESEVSAALQRGLARAAAYEAADRLRPTVRLAHIAISGEEDCSAVHALMHSSARDAMSFDAVQRGLARAAAYEAADRLQPTVRLAQIAISGEEDCSAVHSQLHARSLPSELAVLRGLARAAAYEAADSMRPTVSLALTAQHGEEDCSAVHALMHSSARDAISLDAVQRGLARAAAYEAADSMRPTVSLALTAQHGEEDCSAVHALMHARGSSSVAAVMRGLARAGVYETADLLDGLDPTGSTGCSPSAPNSALNPLLALSTTLWLDAVALSLRPGGLPSVEVVLSCAERIRHAVLRERERQLLRMQDEDHVLRRMLAAHHNAASHSQLSPLEAKSSWLIAVHHVEYAAHLAASITPGPTNVPAAFHCDRQTPTSDSTAGKALADDRIRQGSPRALHAAALHIPSLLSRQQAPAATSHPAQQPPSPSDRARASALLLRPPSRAQAHPAQNYRKHPRKNGKLHKPHSSAPRSTPGSSAQMNRGQRSASRLRADKPSGTGV
jgi:hypothetical protein